MIPHGTQIAQGDSGYARRAYEVQRIPKAKRPRCEVCGARLAVDLIVAGEPVCSKHIEEFREMSKAKFSKKLPRHLEGPPAPKGTGSDLKEMRLGAGLSQTIVAAEVGCSHKTLGLWEREIRPVSLVAAEGIEKAIRRIS